MKSNIILLKSCHGSSCARATARYSEIRANRLTARALKAHHSQALVEVVGVGPLARAYGGRWVSTAAEAAEALAALVEPGDVILVKGSRSVGLEVVAAKLTGQ